MMGGDNFLLYKAKPKTYRLLPGPIPPRSEAVACDSRDALDGPGRLSDDYWQGIRVIT